MTSTDSLEAGFKVAPTQGHAMLSAEAKLIADLQLKKFSNTNAP
jgi:hypothetical protein